MTDKVMCPYCGQAARLVKGLEIYPGRPDLKYLNFYSCKGSDGHPHEHAYVGTHRGTTTPLGRLADATLRAAKQAAHRQFDQLWRNKHMSRSEAYRWLAESMELPAKLTHIGMFDITQCQRVEKLARRKLALLDFGE